jgi:hypothetical protein
MRLSDMSCWASSVTLRNKQPKPCAQVAAVTGGIRSAAKSVVIRTELAFWNMLMESVVPQQRPSQLADLVDDSRAEPIAGDQARAAKDGCVGGR